MRSGNDAIAAPSGLPHSECCSPRARAGHVARRVHEAELRVAPRGPASVPTRTEALVVGQIALALLVLSAAGLITRSFMKLERVELAFEPSRLLIAELGLPYQGFGDTRKQLALLDRLLPRLEAIPGVRAVSPVLTAPFVSWGDFRHLGQRANRRGARTHRCRSKW